MENENQNEIVESQNTEIAPEQRYYNGPVTLEEAESYITSGLVSTARNYVAIGYWLRRIRDGKLYEEEGHQNFEQYVHEKYGKDKGWASKCIKVNQQLSKDGDSPLLDSRYRDYSTYQLVELAYMTEEQREQATPEQTIKQLQEIRKPKEIPYYDIDGQQEMEKDYPEVIPVVMSQLFPGEEIPEQEEQEPPVVEQAEVSQYFEIEKEEETSAADEPENAAEKQQEELMKLQEQGYKPTAGCMPMLVNFLVVFGVIEVVYRPLQRIFHIGADALTAAGEALTAMGISFTTVTRDTNIIAQVIAGESTVSSCFTPDQVATITEFGQHMDFFGIDLTRVPQYSLAAENLPLLILPVLAIVTMFLSTHISMKASGQEMQGSMKLTMYMMPLMYVFFCFTVPSAFSLYYVVSNILMTVQSLLMKKIYDPEKMKAEVAAEMAARKKEQKRGVKSTTIKVTDEKTGEVVEKNISASEMNKRRLEYARKLDEERYKDERTVPLSELENKKED